MGSRFENFDLGRAVAKLLKLKDTKNFPVHLNTDELQPVLGVPGPMIPDTWSSATLTNKFLVGIQSWYYSLFGGLVSIANDFASPDPDSLFQGKAHWVRQCRLLVSYDAAGSAADAGKILVFSVTLTDGGTGFNTVVQHQAEVKSGLNFYEWIYPECNILDQSVGFTKQQWGGKWNGYVPPGWRVLVGVAHNPAAVFPANTSLNGETLISTMPEGMLYQGPT